MSRRALELPANDWMDRVGASLSFACAVHCALAPMVMALLPLAAGAWLYDTSVETSFVFSSTGVAFASLGLGFRVHHNRRIFAFVGAAALLIALGRAVADGMAEVALVTVGALTLAGAHVWNQHLCRSCRTCAATPAVHGTSAPPASGEEHVE